MAEAGFELVSQDELGRTNRPHYFRTHAFTLWCAHPGLVGIFSTAPQAVPDLQLSKALIRSISSANALRDLVVDLRGFGVEGAIFAYLLHEAGPWLSFLRTHVRRLALVMPDDWSNLWWTGSIPLWVPSKVRLEIFGEVTAAADWLGGSPGLRRALSGLEETVHSESKVRFALQTLLRADPLLNIDQAAGKLGVSSRSLQRALKQSGENFAAIRDRVRAALATSLLTQTDSKVDTVGATVGFRSRSHFMSWFRRITGHSPGAFRQRNNHKQHGA